MAISEKARMIVWVSRCPRFAGELHLIESAQGSHARIRKLITCDGRPAYGVRHGGIDVYHSGPDKVQSLALGSAPVADSPDTR